MASDAPLILAIDTSAAHCAAAVVEGDKVLTETTEPMTKGQAERLFPLINEILTQTGKTLADLSAIAVCTGPGNFTGIRIGVAAARGLALSLDRPAIGVSRLEALAFAVKSPAVTSVGGPRGRIYAQAFGADGAPLSAPETGAPEELTTTLSATHPTLVIGAESNALAALLNCAAGPAIDTPPPSAIARLALTRIDNPGPRPAPLYLRPADAAPSRDQPPAILP